MAAEAGNVKYCWSSIREAKVEVSRVYDDGYLFLEEDPVAWIQSHPAAADRLSVRILELKLLDVDKITDMIGELSDLTHLYFYCSNLKCLPDTITRLSNLQLLELVDFDKLEELPENLGELESLTHLSLCSCEGIKSLPNSLANLTNLTTLDLQYCETLTELPPNLGELESLTHFSLFSCQGIKSLPNSFTNLSNLTTLKFFKCNPLIELPPNLGELESLTHLSLSSCQGIKSLPNSLTNLSNLTTLNMFDCNSLTELPRNLGDLESLAHISLSICEGIKSLPNSLANLSNLTTLNIYQCNSLTELPPNLNVIHIIIKRCCSIKALPTGLSNLASLHLTQCLCNYGLANLKDSLNLRHLTLESCECNVHADVIEFLANLDELLQLSVVDIQDTKVRYLPWSITKLLNLKLLCLPRGFILETLPNHLNDSVIIYMKDCHVRKTWKELKTEIQVDNLGISMYVPRNPSCHLWLDTNKSLRQWLQNNYDFQTSVKFLDLQFLDDEFGDLTLLKELTHVTHLYISSNVNLWRLPDTLTNITHLSLHRYYTDDLLDSLAEPSNLVSLDLDVSETYLPSNIHQFVNLKCLTVRNAQSEPLVPDNSEKLSNLKSLVLYKCVNVSLPTHLNLTNLKLVNCFIKNVSLLPTSLHRLELLHSKYYFCEKEYCSKEPIICLNQLVNLKTLSITCYQYTSNLLPSIAELRNLKELQLKDCFGLKELPPDLDELVELSILNISGTRIKSFPDCIIRLQKLRHVILPKCFKKENLPINIETTYDVTDEEYYKKKGYYDSDYDTSSDDESNEIAVVDSAEGAESDDELVSEFSQEGIIAQQISADANVNQLLGDTHFTGRSNTMGESSQVQEMETSSTGLNSNTNEINLTDQMLEFGFGNSSFDFGHISYSDVTNIDRVENNHHASEYTQNNENPPSDENQGKRQKKEITHEKNPCLMDKNMTQVNLGEELGKFNHNGGEDAVDGINHNGGEDAVYEISHSASCGSPDQDMENMPVGNDKESTSTIVGRGRGKKIEIKLTREELQSYWSRNMTVEDVAKDIDVSRSTFKRWLKASGIKWQTSRISKSQCANNKNTNTESSSGSKPAKFNLVKPFNTPAAREHAPECLSDANERVVVNNLTLAVTMDTEEEPGVATRCHSNGSEQASDTLVGADQRTQQESPSLSKIIVKATYKDDTVRFHIFSTTSFHELEKEVAKNLKLKLSKFKIKYEDEEKELILMTLDSHLKELLDLSKSSGSKIVRLLIFDL
ncbi:hypothetical protein BVRB_5g125940 [Beta vulgaris subsp. vulgaris]|uniref:PB1 domain-containing protein n=1 Tax=Beta vulgaris subsp. vulgaris TaxID=3555 RepID=A0A0J8E3A6_BETVV|nr:hypothetical protein BVRB_5g125940 [Beta vulgaris subsp. vulgaris]